MIVCAKKVTPTARKFESLNFTETDLVEKGFLLPGTSCFSQLELIDAAPIWTPTLVPRRGKALPCVAWIDGWNALHRPVAEKTMVNGNIHAKSRFQIVCFLGNT